MKIQKCWLIFCLICCLLCACSTDKIKEKESYPSVTEEESYPSVTEEESYETLITLLKYPTIAKYIIDTQHIEKDYLKDIYNTTYKCKDGTTFYSYKELTCGDNYTDALFILDENKFNQLTIGAKQKYIENLFIYANDLAYITENTTNTQLQYLLRNINTNTVHQLYEYLETKEGVGSILMASIIEAKPVIYLYGYDTTVHINFEQDVEDSLLYTYPRYENGWTVQAKPDGTLRDSNREYNYLFWEGIPTYVYKVTEGFCVKGSDTISFLEDKLTILGLNDKEQDDFISYWLPQMERNAYNVIAFKTEEYEEHTKVTINPVPENKIRILMVWFPCETLLSLPEQCLAQKTVDRTQPTIVEWGGIKIDNFESH